MGRADFFPDPLGDFVRDKGVFDEEALRERGVNLLEQGPIFRGPVKKMIAYGNDDLARKAPRFLEAARDKAALIGAEVDDSGYSVLNHKRRSLAHF